MTFFLQWVLPVIVQLAVLAFAGWSAWKWRRDKPLKRWYVVAYYGAAEKIYFLNQHPSSGMSWGQPGAWTLALNSHEDARMMLERSPVLNGATFRVISKRPA